jgi:hypothetical protein
MAGEAVASPMRIATAPGRLARPAPSGNDDPCEERRTIPEGLPRLPREAFKKRSQTGGSDAHPSVQRRTASTGPGQKSHVERRKGERIPSPGYAGRLTRKSGWLARGAAYRTRPRASCGAQRTQGGHLLGPVRSMRRPQAGHGLPIGVRRKHPSATGAPHAPREGAAKKKRIASSE